VLLTRPPLAPRRVPVRLACIRHAASVCPEPGSNSPNKIRLGYLQHPDHFILEELTCLLPYCLSFSTLQLLRFASFFRSVSTGQGLLYGIPNPMSRKINAQFHQFGRNLSERVECVRLTLSLRFPPDVALSTGTLRCRIGERAPYQMPPGSCSR
jgi:hypothetical protein